MRRPILVVGTGILLSILLTGAAIEPVDARGDTYRYLANFADTFELAKRNYVEEVDTAPMLEGAYRGLLEELEPESFYLTPELAAQYGKPPAERGGLGIDISKRLGYGVVVSVLPGSPADGKLSPGDLLRLIDGHSLRPISVYEIRQAILGKPGSEVRLRLVRAIDLEDVELTLTRAEVSAPRFVPEAVVDGILKLKIPVIDQEVVNAVASALRAAVGVTGVVLDLRGCSRGDLESGVALADLFLDSGPLLTIEGRANENAIKRQLGALVTTREDVPASPDSKSRFRYQVQARTETTAWRGPIAVLTDLGTAGAAEIVAGALAPLDRSHSLGQPSFGRGAIHDLIPLADGAAVHLAVGRIVTADGTSILNQGLTPDEVIELAKKGETGDPVLDRAREHLKLDGRKKKAA